MSTVAFLTPHFNRHELFPATLESMKAQTLTDWECWLVDDGSSDESVGIIRKMISDEPRVHLLRRDREPKGACTCRNIGAVKTKAKYVISLDTDDIIEPFCLQQRVDAMEANPELDFAIFPSLMFENKPNDLGRWWNVDTGEDLLERQFRQDAICQGTGVMFTTEAFRRIGMWSESLALWQDIDLFFRAFIQDYKYKKFFDLPADLHNRTNHRSLSRADFYNRQKQESRFLVVKEAVRLLKEHRQASKLRWVRFMVAEIANGNAKGRHFDLAKDVADFGLAHNVLTKEEHATLGRIRNLYRWRLYRIPGVKNWLDKACQRINCKSLLGRVPVGEESECLESHMEAAL